MTAEHDGYEAYEAYDGHDVGHDGGDAGLDALMAVLTDRPLPDEARADAAFMAEHRAATADVVLLREQLGLLAEALSEPAAVPKPAPMNAVRPVRTRRPRALNLAFGAFAVVAVAAVLSGMAWLLTQTGSTMAGGASDSAAKASDGKSDQGPMYVACSRLVAEGDVTAVERVPGTGQRRVTLRVTHYYKPSRGKDELTFLTDESIDPAPREGDHVLVGFADRAAAPDLWVTGKQEIADRRAALVPDASPSASGTPACG
ncbi:hypothetical protein [Streptomyces sp. HUAS TT20]|uniref:hypothetical protein n=1 Tax=Streptomyces sp. HUAS TT20 TaxID=3447509 RepID=UPI0021DA48DA|nr:hypothetical protein [Streptomyces sp. HUAS 15-9]UXY27607.1 hypothetical protein N8I87_14155 [Streptomyces sp. HUAS 15-9]